MSLRSNRILIVDDEEDLTWSISRSLTKNNDMLEVICVNSGDDALHALEQNAFDLVISDLRMPGISGMALLDQVKQNHPKTKMIIMTAYGSPDIERKIRSTENAYYIEKPFDIHELKKLIFKVNWNQGELNSSVDDVDLNTNVNIVYH
ncbi:response regulator [candidate division KSB1 bacterium]|nr:response regulator [candidate division KSB1 bacterium]